MGKARRCAAEAAIAHARRDFTVLMDSRAPPAEGEREKFGV